MTAFTKTLTDETCWLHKYALLYFVEFSNGNSGFYCSHCDGESHPYKTLDSRAEAAMRQYERQIDRKIFWQDVLDILTLRRWRA